MKFVVFTAALALALSLLFALCVAQNNNIVMQSSDLQVTIVNRQLIELRPIQNGTVGTEVTTLFLNNLTEVSVANNQFTEVGHSLDFRTVQWNVQGPTTDAAAGTQTVLFTATVPVSSSNATTNTTQDVNLELDAILFDNEGVVFQGSERIFVPADSLKFAFKFMNWPFLSANNELNISATILQTGVANQVTLVNNTRIVLGVSDQNDQLTYIDFGENAFVDGATSQAVQTSLIDTTASSSSSSYLLLINLPHFNNTVEYSAGSGFLGVGQQESAASMLSTSPMYVMFSLAMIIFGMYCM